MLAVCACIYKDLQGCVAEVACIYNEFTVLDVRSIVKHIGLYTPRCRFAYIYNDLELRLEIHVFFNC